MYRSHGIVLSQNKGLDVEVGGPETYVVSFPQILKLVECAVEGFPSRVKNPGRLRENFVYLHWNSKV